MKLVDTMPPTYAIFTLGKEYAIAATSLHTDKGPAAVLFSAIAAMYTNHDERVVVVLKSGAEITLRGDYVISEDCVLIQYI